MGLDRAPARMDLYHSLLDRDARCRWSVVAVYAYRTQPDQHLHHGWDCSSVRWSSCPRPTISSIRFSNRTSSDRILSFLGIISDPLGTDYNVNQSKIAIGSGGFWGKGFLRRVRRSNTGSCPKSTPTSSSAPWARSGDSSASVVVLALLCLLILRLMRMGERQQEPFGRIYCYCVAAILLFHVLVNVGMTIGLMPVMGIPLPFMSYGGSSLIAFTILLFIAVRLDASTRQFSVHKL